MWGRELFAQASADPNGLARRDVIESDEKEKWIEQDTMTSRGHENSFYRQGVQEQQEYQKGLWLSGPKCRQSE